MSVAARSDNLTSVDDFPWADDRRSPYRLTATRRRPDEIKPEVPGRASPPRRRGERAGSLRERPRSSTLRLEPLSEELVRPFGHLYTGGRSLIVSNVTHWTHDRIVDVLIDERLASGKFPRPRDWRVSSDLHPCCATVVRRFGTWLDAIAAADQIAQVEDAVSVSSMVVQFAVASLPASDARRVWPVVYRFDYAPPEGELRIGRGSLQQFLWRDLPRARGVKLAEKVRTVAPLARFLRVLPDSPAAATFAATCESRKTATALIRRA